jgi:hypothetical protein
MFEGPNPDVPSAWRVWLSENWQWCLVVGITISLLAWAANHIELERRSRVQEV